MIKQSALQQSGSRKALAHNFLDEEIEGDIKFDEPYTDITEWPKIEPIDNEEDFIPL